MKNFVKSIILASMAIVLIASCNNGSKVVPGDAIFKAQTMIGDEPFGVILADDICDTPNNPGVMKQMVELFNKHQKSIVAIMEVPKDKTDAYGIISGQEIEKDVYQIETMIEKPNPEEAPTNLAIIGRYILTPEVFSYLKNTKPGAGGEIQITDALKEMAKNGKVLAYKFKGIRFDCGSVDGYVKSINYFYDKSKFAK